MNSSLSIPKANMNENDILLKAIMDGGRHSILVTHRSGVVKFMNQAAERMYGFPAAHFMGRHVSNFRMEIYDPVELEVEAGQLSREFGREIPQEDVFMALLKAHGSYEREWTAIRQDGTRIHVLVTVTAMKDERDEITGFLSVSQDITERMRLERMKAEFVSVISHELRTPLTSIRGALGLLVSGAAGGLPATALDLVTLAHRNCGRLARIINDILDLEKLESGQFTFDIRPFEPGHLLTQSLEENQAYGEKHGVRFLLKGQVPPDRVSGDPDRVLQVLANLLSNAAKFSPHGAEVWVEAREAGEFTEFSVRDFGEGIPEAFRSCVFQRFAQSENAKPHGSGGSGLGLNIARKMVEAMGGTIRFQTETGRGTTFTFSLPRLAVNEPAAATSRDGAATSRDGENPRVLICEDDGDTAAVLRLLLKRAGFQSDVAPTIAEGWKWLREKRYAAMTLDLRMPDMDGLQFLRELRAGGPWSRLPVIVVSAKAREGRLEMDANPVELVDWIEKPIDEGALLQSLSRALTVRNDARPRILHVEDDRDLRDVLGRFLADKADLTGADSLREARARLEEESFDIVILDVALPDGSGLELLENLEARRDRPVSVLILSSEPAGEDVRGRVAAVLQKSRVSEERVVQAVLSLVGQAARSDPSPGRPARRAP